ncbi:extracellular solute-binding protein [Fundicoccus sp. Sow4_H7]|uniref:extracellular solute-binding protein n=1 Tax=Fundicoccus sp. Sow4_H7 TaxID=3438784 RepID=UPI003F92D190
MKKSLTKFVSSLAITTFLVGSVASSSQMVLAQEDDEARTLTTFPIVEEPIQLSLIAPGTGMAEWKDMPVLQEMTRLTNIEWEYITPPMSDFSTRLNLAFASGDLPDVIFAAGSSNLTRGMEIDYGSQGILIPLEDYLEENAPNLSAILDENPDIRKSITAPDGHIYSLPVINRGSYSIWPLGPMWYNGAWMEALGVDTVPTTTDEFYDLLVRMKEEDPNGNGEADEIPLTDVALNTIRLYMMASFGLKSNSIDEVDGVVRFTPITDNYRAYLEYMNRLHVDGLLDPETFSQSNEQKKAKGQNNQIGVFQDYFSFFTLGGSEKEAVANPMFQVLTSEYSPETLAVASPRIQTGTFAITSQNEYPAESIQWVDYFYSEEGYELLNQGPEGALWNYAENDEGEQVKIFNLDNVNLDNTEDYRGQITPAYGIPVPALEIDLDPIYADPNQEVDTTFFDFLVAETAEKVTPYAEVPYPITYLTVEEQDIISINATDLATFVTEMEAKFITGVEELNDDTWQNYLNIIDSMGVEEYIQIYQDAYDRWANS